jgi:hypothetical protein
MSNIVYVTLMTLVTGTFSVTSKASVSQVCNVCAYHTQANSWGHDLVRSNVLSVDNADHQRGKYADDKKYLPKDTWMDVA